MTVRAYAINLGRQIEVHYRLIMTGADTREFERSRDAGRDVTTVVRKAGTKGFGFIEEYECDDLGQLKRQTAKFDSPTFVAIPDVLDAPQL